MKSVLTVLVCILATSATFAQEGARNAEPPRLAAPAYCATVRFECPTTGTQTPDVKIGGIPGGCSALDAVAEDELKRLYPGFQCDGEDPVLVYVSDCHVCKPGEWPPVPVPDPEPLAARSATAEPPKVCGMTCYYTFANGKKRGFSAYGPCARQLIATKACRYAKENCTTICSCDKCKCTEVSPDVNVISGCRQCR